MKLRSRTMGAVLIAARARFSEVLLQRELRGDNRRENISFLDDPNVRLSTIGMGTSLRF